MAMFIGEAGRADHGLDAQLAADLQVRQSAFGACEVNQEARIFQPLLQIRRHRHATGFTQKGRGVLSQCRAGRDVQRTGQAAVIGGQDGLDQHVSHAAGGTGHGNGQSVLLRHWIL
jgi:hypothetical protein